VPIASGTPTYEDSGVRRLYDLPNGNHKNLGLHAWGFYRPSFSEPMRTLMAIISALWIALIILVAIATGADARDAKQVRLFRAANPCPATVKATGACPGWVVDHIKPLCAGGANAPVNMQWQTRADSLVKDREEQQSCMARIH